MFEGTKMLCPLVRLLGASKLYEVVNAIEYNVKIFSKLFFFLNTSIVQ